MEAAVSLGIVHQRLSTLESQLIKMDVLLQHLMEWTHFKPPPNLDILVKEKQQEQEQKSGKHFLETQSQKDSSILIASTGYSTAAPSIAGTSRSMRSSTRKSSRTMKSGNETRFPTAVAEVSPLLPPSASSVALASEITVKEEAVSSESEDSVNHPDSDFELLPHSYSPEVDAAAADQDIGDIGHRIPSTQNSSDEGEEEYTQDFQDCSSDDGDSSNSYKPNNSSSNKRKYRRDRYSSSKDDLEKLIASKLPKRKRNSKGPYNCDTCGHQTRLKAELVEHQRLHKVKPKNCTNCGNTLMVEPNDVQLDHGNNDQLPKVLCHICGTPGEVEPFEAGRKPRKIRDWILDQVVDTREEAEKIVLQNREWKYKNQYQSKEGRVIKYVCREGNSCGSRRRILIPTKPIRGQNVLIHRTVGDHDHNPRPPKNRGITKEHREKIGELIMEGYVRPRAILNELQSQGIQAYTLLQIRNYIQHYQKKHSKDEPQEATAETQPV